MNGKILKISGNDLYGNVDDRSIAVFAAFTHEKYMNKYIIYTYEGEFDKKKLYYGSLHLKDNSLVIFSVNKNVKQYIDAFIQNYLNNQINPNEYKIIDISKYEKVEIVSSSDCDFDKLEVLDQISINRPKQEETDEMPKSKKIFLGILLIFMLALLGGISYLYMFPEKFLTEYNQLECNSEAYNQEIRMKYHSYKLFKYDKSNLVKEVNVIDTYTFNNSTEYYDFKNNHKESEYFHINGEYKYDDEYLNIKLTYNEDSIIDDPDELKSYMKREGYKCQEGKYYE